MSIRTTVAQVGMAGGCRTDRPGGTLVDERSPRLATGRRRGNLYALVEVSGPVTGRDILVRQMLDLVHEAYYRWQGSVTAGLQQAIHEANNLLFQENRDSLPGEQRTAGISCVVLRDASQDLFVAQAGPAAVFLAHEGQVIRYPDLSPWLDDVPLEELDAAPLGARRDPSVALFHVQVGAGDRFLVVDSPLARHLIADALVPDLARVPAEEVLDALVSASGGSDMSALLVQVNEEEAAGVSGRLSRPVSVPEETTPSPQPITDKLSGWWDQLNVRGALRTAGRGLAALFAGLGAALLTLLRRMLPGKTGPQQALDATATPSRKAELPSHPKQAAKRPQAAVRPDAATRPQAAVRPEVRGGAQRGASMGSATAQPEATRPRERNARQPRGDLSRRFLVASAIVIPLIVVAVVVSMYVQRGQAQRAEIETLWQKANDNWEQGSALADKATASARLREAMTALNELIERRPERTDAIDLRTRVQARLDEITKVRRITSIASLKTYPGDAKLTRVVAEGGHLFVLDRNAGRVYHHQLDSLQETLDPATSDTVAISRGSQLGGMLVADLVDMVWIAAGEGHQKGTLAVLDSDGALFELDPATGTVSAARVAAFETWQLPKLVGSYFGRFYVLDTTANKIWRYMPAADGYTGAPDDWLKSATDLVGALDMAIGDSIYVLSADGTIRRLTTGEADKFDISDWDMPPNNPGAIFTRPPDQVQSVYVADRGNSRIVQSKPDGLFEGQFLLAGPSAGSGGNALSTVTSLFVDEISQRAFFLSGNTLYMVKLPK